MLSEILNFNREFVARKDYLPYQTTKYPDRKLTILTCMDTRLTHLLPAALGLRNGEVKMIKNAGGVVLAPYGGVVRSLLVAVLELGVEEIPALGQPFDPNLHNAVMHVEDDSVGENTIVDVFQAGFKSGDKVVRFAMVKVAN